MEMCPFNIIASCSVACNKSHRQTHPPESEAPAQPPATSHRPEPELLKAAPPVDPANPWRVLHDCEPLRQLFRKYPNLEQQLEEINAATLPPSSEDSIVRTPGLTIHTRANWNRDIGVQKGLDALRKAKMAPGPDGEAIREYSDLIIFLMHGQDHDGKVSEALQQSRAQDEKNFLQELMNAHRR